MSSCSQISAELAALRADIAALDGRYILKNEKPQIINESVDKSYNFIYPKTVAFVDSEISPIKGEINILKIAVDGLVIAVQILEATFNFLTNQINKLFELFKLPGKVQALENRVSSAEGKISTLENFTRNIERIASEALRLAQNAYELASLAKNLAEKAIQDIKILTQQILAALKRLENLIYTQIARLSRDIDNIIGRISEIILRVVRLERIANFLESFTRGIANDVQKIFNDLRITKEVVRLAYLFALQALRELYILEGELGEQIQILRLNIFDVNKKAQQAQGTAQQAQGTAQQAQGTAQQAQGTAQQAQGTAQQAQGTAQQANNLSQETRRIVDDLVRRVNQLGGQVNNVINNIINNVVNNTINNVTNIVNNMQVDFSPIISRLNSLDNKIAGVPAATVGALIVSSSFQEAAKTAAAAGTCRTLQPGGCGNNSIRNIANNASNDFFKRITDWFNAGANAIQLAYFRRIDSKLGNQIQGGISGKLINGFKWLQIDRALNILSFAATVHNAAMLSQNIFQTLFQAIQNVIDFIGLKDDSGQSFNISSAVGSTVTSLLQGIIGKDNYEAFIKQWNAVNRIYQASANLVSSLMSMGDSIVNALQVIGGQTGKIGNALRAWGVVSEKAYGWMNPTPNFTNPILTKLNSIDETASMVENVTQQPLSIKSEKENLEQASKDLADSIGQLPDTPQGKIFPEASKVKEEQNASKAVSQGPELSSQDLEADE